MRRLELGRERPDLVPWTGWESNPPPPAKRRAHPLSYRPSRMGWLVPHGGEPLRKLLVEDGLGVLVVPVTPVDVGIPAIHFRFASSRALCACSYVLNCVNA